MTLITPEELVSQTAELVRSLQASIAELRQEAEDLKQQIRSGGEADLANGAKRIMAAEQLARACLKTEANLVEYCNRKAGIVRGGYALDLDQARFEIGCRLARLRQCGRAGSIPN